MQSFCFVVLRTLDSAHVNLQRTEIQHVRPDMSYISIKCLLSIGLVFKIVIKCSVFLFFLPWSSCSFDLDLPFEWVAVVLLAHFLFLPHDTVVSFRDLAKKACQNEKN